MSKLLLLVAISCLVLSCSAYDTSFPSFLNFVQKYKKTYDSMEEFQTRFAVFQETGKRVGQLRADHFKATGESGDDVYGITKFSDLTPEEFKARYLNFRPNAANIRGRSQVANVHKPSSTLGRAGAIPSTLDWRNDPRKPITAVKDQGQCGSCWAFSATEEIESMWILSNHTSVNLAPQQIVSCDTTDGGCNGGDTTTAYAYVKKAGGLEPEADYPYVSGGTGENGICKFKKTDVVASLSGFTYAIPPCTGACNDQNMTALAVALNDAPISICVYAEIWQSYIGGILKTGCPHSFDQLDHCVQLVGYNEANSTPYWIIRNSWNTDWGIDGYIYVATANNLCGVGDEATIVTI